MVQIWFQYDGDQYAFYETPSGITFEEVRYVAMNMTRCRTEHFQIHWQYGGENYEVEDQIFWDRVLEICTEQIVLVVIPNWYATELEDDDDYEHDDTFQYADNEMHELSLHMRGLGLRGGNPEGESSANAGRSSTAEWEEPEVGDRDDVYSSDSGAEPFEELVNRENRVGVYQFPEHWISGEWQQGLECNDLEIHAASSSTTSEYFNKKTPFPNKKALQKYVKTWHIEHSRQCYSPRSCQSEILFKCRNERCSWDLRATSARSGVWKIVRVGVPHTCVNDNPIKHHKNLDSKMIEDVIYQMVKSNNSVKIKVLQDMMKDSKYHEYPTYRKVWYAKCNVIESLYGTHASAFGELPQLLLAIQHFNPGSVFDFQFRYNENPDIHMFDKCFWAYAPAIHAFQHCRPLISIDGTHLYGKYTGKLLIAVAYDAANQVVPLAFCLCDKESSVTWTWFLTHLQEHVTKDRVVTIISDRHAGIIRGLNDVYPHPHTHRCCARHLASNFNTHFKNKRLKEDFSDLIYEVNKKTFLTQVEMWKTLDDGKYKRFIDRIGEYEKWSLAFDDGMRWGIMTTNHSECFNKVLKDSRCLPVTALVLESFRKMVTYWVDRKKNAEDEVRAKHRYAPKIIKLLKQASRDAMECRIETYQLGVIFYVSPPGCDLQYTVNLVDRVCDCNKWTLFGVPCCHAIAAIVHTNSKTREFVSPFLTNKTRIATYSMPFQTLRQKSDWPSWDGLPVVVDPMMLIVERGRKKKENSQ